MLFSWCRSLWLRIFFIKSRTNLQAFSYLHFLSLYMKVIYIRFVFWINKAGVLRFEIHFESFSSFLYSELCGWKLISVAYVFPFAQFVLAEEVSLKVFKLFWDLTTSLNYFHWCRYIKYLVSAVFFLSFRIIWPSIFTWKGVLKQRFHTLVYCWLNNIPLPRFTGINIYNVWFHWCFFCHPVWDDLKL